MCWRVKRHDGRGIEVLAVARGAVVHYWARRAGRMGRKIRLRSASSVAAPQLAGEPTGGNPIILRPGFRSAGLAGMRNGVEKSVPVCRGVKVLCAHIHCRPVGVVLFALCARDDQVAIDGTGRTHVIRRRGKFIGNGRTQIDGPFIAEPRYEFPRFGIDRDQTSVACPGKNLRRGLLVARPIRDAAKGGAIGCFAEFEFPDLFAGFGFEGDDGVVEGGGVENAVDHDGHSFGGGEEAGGGIEVHVGGVDVVLPGGAELWCDPSPR